ncbi:hypothetical protein KZE55_05190 [Limosilactobacillus panis]|uniref:hypothetical protein n=1 Tax=Limosilactobacillus panis TaxID=47493 RepID=UPI001C966D82|nr:hypothetical protein [Limosilactobacillus panis]QZN92233.1 hypothetical protein KZE55_05190 [Limosilactobacillus panis]
MNRKTLYCRSQDQETQRATVAKTSKRQLSIAENMVPANTQENESWVDSDNNELLDY